MCLTDGGDRQGHGRHRGRFYFDKLPVSFVQCGNEYDACYWSFIFHVGILLWLLKFAIKIELLTRNPATHLTISQDC